MMSVEYKDERGDVLLRQDEICDDFREVLAMAREAARVDARVKTVIIRDALGDAELDLTYAGATGAERQPVRIKFSRKAIR
jgi:hypothetical protein